MKLFLSLGSNLGNKEDNIEQAIALINSKIGSVVRRSNLYATEPVGFVSDNSFVNVVVEVYTKLPVYRVLKITQRIEKQLGRQYKSKNGIYRDRTIDIDLLTYSNLTIRSARLTLPHPRMKERDFVMIPLREIKNR